MGFIVGLVLGALAGWHFADKDTNKAPVYGDYGLPRNCRAIVEANVKGYNEGRFTPVEALGSINRNCGSNGYSWGR